MSPQLQACCLLQGVAMITPKIGSESTQSLQPELSQSSKGLSYPLALTALTTLFFLWGFVTSFNDILIPHLKAVFSLNYAQAMAVNMAFFGAYALVSYPASIQIKKLGYQAGLVAGLLVSAFGALLFAWTATHLSYPMTLAALFILASGITMLQVAANPYVICLGSAHSASTRLTMTQAFNSLGTTIAPAVGALLILSQMGTSETGVALASSAVNVAEKAAKVQIPYLALAGLLFALAILFSWLKLPKVQQHQESQPTGIRTVLKHRHLSLGVIAIFVYVGAEVGIGSFMVNYFSDPAIAGLTEHQAAQYVSLYWGGALLGRFLGLPLLHKFKPSQVLKWNAIAAASFLLISMNSSGPIALYSLILVGLFNSIMFPTIFSLALEKLGVLASQGSGLLCVAIVGGAIMPMLQGLYADQAGVQLSFVVPFLCYLYIVYYGHSGYKVEDRVCSQQSES